MTLKGAIIFYREGGAVYLWGGTRIFLGGLRGGPVFFHWVKGGDQNFLGVQEGGTRIFFQEGGTRFFFAPSAQLIIINY